MCVDTYITMWQTSVFYKELITSGEFTFNTA